jgi:hypothetical protein
MLFLFGEEFSKRVEKHMVSLICLIRPWSTFYLEITGRDELSYTDAAQVKGLAEVGGGQQVVFASVTFKTVNKNTFCCTKLQNVRKFF